MDEYKRRRRRSRAVMSMFLDSLGGSIDNVDVATFDSDGTDLKALVVGIEPVQDLHGYESPWPAGGGKNKLPTITSATTLNGVTWTPNADGTIKVNGTATANSVIDLGRNVLTLPAGTYTTNQGVANQYDVNVFRLVNGSGVLHAQGGTFTLTEESSIFVRFAVLTGKTVNNVIIQPMLESGSARTSFAPYSNICPITGHTSVNVIVSPTLNPLDGTITNIPLGTTVFGGQLDVLTGVLTVDRALATFNGSEVWYDYPSFQGFYTNIYGMMAGIRQDGISNMLNNSKSTASGQKNVMWLGVNSSYFFALGVYETMGNTIEDFKTFLSSNNLQVVYPLATPQIIQLTGQQIATFLGTNNVWCDSGKIIHLEY